jgi:hypothetical protein
MSRYVAHMGDMRNAYKILIRKPEGKRPVGRPILENLRDIRWGKYGLDLSGSGSEQVMFCFEHSNEPLDSVEGRKCLYLLSDH